MLLHKSNLYAKGESITFSDGENWLIRDTVDYNYNEGDTYHKVVEGDRLDTIAYKYYSKEVEQSQMYWHVIADANLIENPLDIEQYIGQNILIPNLKYIELT